MEVAQTSFIADPVIGTIQEGVVEDVQILDASMEQTVVERILLEAFNGLTGAAAKGVEDVKAWAREHAGSVRDFPPAPAPSRTGKAAAGTATPDPAGK